MLLNAPSVERLVEAFRKLPGVGKRTAERYALHLLAAPMEESIRISEAVREARERIVRCSVCCNLTEEDPCGVCGDARRDQTLVCVVERPAGAMAIEAGGVYKGAYHILHGALNPLDGIGPDELTVERLIKRIKAGGVREIIVATNATAEGDATALYLSHRVGEFGIDVTRIAHGVPMGGGLEYADAMTLTHALHGRTKLE